MSTFDRLRVCTIFIVIALDLHRQVRKLDEVMCTMNKFTSVSCGETQYWALFAFSVWHSILQSVVSNSKPKCGCCFWFFQLAICYLFSEENGGPSLRKILMGSCSLFLSISVSATALHNIQSHIRHLLLGQSQNPKSRAPCLFVRLSWILEDGGISSSLVFSPLICFSSNCRVVSVRGGSLSSPLQLPVMWVLVSRISVWQFGGCWGWVFLFQYLGTVH